MPKVSVLTVTHNHEPFIGDCIRSVLAQAESDWEQIIVDDGSSDGTVAAAEGFGDPRIRVIRQEKLGIHRLAETYNRGLAECRSPVIAILEGDDMFPSDKFATQLHDFDDPEVVLSSGLIEILGAGGGTISKRPYLLPDNALVNEPIGVASHAMMRPMYLTFTFPVATMLRLETIKGIGGFQTVAGLPVTDYPTFLAMGLKGKWHWHDQVVGIWRRHSASTTANRLPEILEGTYRASVDFLNAHFDELALSDAQILHLENEWRHFQAVRASSLARELASERKWGGATQLFCSASLLAPGIGHTMKYRVASVLSALRINPERLLRLAHMPPWQELLKIGDDRIVHKDTKPEEISLRMFRRN